VHEGDMPAEDATSERYRLGSKEICLAASNDGVELLPGKLRDLLHRSDNLYRRIQRLDDVLFAAARKRSAGVKDQINRLEQAFSSDGAA